MRSDLPVAVSELISTLRPSDGPQLIFDRSVLESTIVAVATAARAASIRVLFAAKSFPHDEVLAMAARHLDGFDIASGAELVRAGGSLGPHQLLSITDPTMQATLLAEGVVAATCMISCEDVAQLERALASAPRAHLAIRLSTSWFGRDAEIGAVQSGNGHHRSRFGVDVAPARCVATIRDMVAVAAAHRRELGIHLHHSSLVATSAARVIAGAQHALNLAHDGGLRPQFLNLGGGWHGVADDLPQLWTAVRTALPTDLPLMVEPGRLFASRSGFAIGWVQVARTLDDRELRVLDLSRACHLRWSQPALVDGAPRPGHGRKILFAGPTCYEDDVLGEWIVDDRRDYRPGEAAVLRNITGYALAWNTGFAGTLPATVRMVG